MNAVLRWLSAAGVVAWGMASCLLVQPIGLGGLSQLLIVIGLVALLAYLAWVLLGRSVDSPVREPGLAGVSYYFAKGRWAAVALAPFLLVAFVQAVRGVPALIRGARLEPCGVASRGDCLTNAERVTGALASQQRLGLLAACVLYLTSVILFGMHRDTVNAADLSRV